MIFSLAFLLSFGLLFGFLCERLRLPSLTGMIAAGILLGPQLLNWLDPSLLAVSSDLRRIALIVILLRAGLKLDFRDLRRWGRTAFLICFIPATTEILGALLLAPRLLGFSLLDAALLGTVIAAVSPAVLVPRMIRLIDEGYGVDKSIPHLLLAGASADDVYVLVLFTSFLSLSQGQSLSALRFLSVPVAVATGVAAGILIGAAFSRILRRFSSPTFPGLLILFILSFLLSAAEEKQSFFPFSSLLAVMALGFALRRREKKTAAEFSRGLDRIWKVAELFLFVLLGASVNLGALGSEIVPATLLLAGLLLFRSAGVFLCLLGSDLSRKEKLFCMIAYTPKATVQAAVGGIPLAAGLPSGEIILAVSVLSILLTAPAGAFAIDLSHTRCLERRVGLSEEVTASEGAANVHGAEDREEELQNSQIL